MKKTTLYTMTHFFFLILISLALTQNVFAQPQNENENPYGKAAKNQLAFSFRNDLLNDGEKTKNSTPRETEKKKPSYDERSSRSSGEDFEEEGKEDERDLMEEALTYLNSSQKFWEQGDIQKALDFLDQAYTLLLETDGDLEIARQKDDLRLLISKRILAIYTSIQTTTRGKRSEIPRL